MSETADQVEPDETSPFYYVECPYCGMEFAAWNKLKPSALDLEEFADDFEAADENDIANVYCPRCGKASLLAINKAPEVFLTSTPPGEGLPPQGDQQEGL
jgi:endogenous inhibitor of DNA gyrase (YacG/DUF329 family)